jgi:predicted metal-dependent hydrolase
MPLALTALHSTQLSLFDEAPPPPARPAPAAAPAPSVFRHPRSQRDIHFGEHLVAYELRRGRRRSIGFVVGAEGLTVSAPRWVGLGDVETALREKAAWILRKLHEQRERSRRLAAARVDWRDGTAIPFLGAQLTLHLDAQASGAVLDADTRRLHLGLPQGASPEQVRDVVQSWLQRQARRVFEERCQVFAARLGVRMTRLSLSSAATRWGSASADGAIRLNWRLVHFAVPVIDYVVTHELAHLREMNHSEAFWGVVRSVLPDYEQARGTLRDEVLPVFD